MIFTEVNHNSYGAAKDIFFFPTVTVCFRKCLLGGTFHNSAGELGNNTAHLLNEKAPLFSQFPQQRGRRDSNEENGGYLQRRLLCTFLYLIMLNVF